MAQLTVIHCRSNWIGKIKVMKNKRHAAEPGEPAALLVVHFRKHFQNREKRDERRHSERGGNQTHQVVRECPFHQIMHQQEMTDSRKRAGDPWRWPAAQDLRKTKGNSRNSP